MISLPESLRKADSISLEVILTDYELSVPQPCHWAGASSGIFTAFCKEHACNEHCCKAICGHEPSCLAASLGPSGCFQARCTTKALQAMREGRIAPVSERQWLQRKVGGKVCRLAGARDCMEGIAGKDHTMHFSRLQPDWLERHAEIKLSLSLAEGSQQFFSDSEGLQLKLGPPDMLDVLVNLTGITHNDEVLYLNATAEVHREDVVVTLMQYPPYNLTELRLYVAVLFPDPNYAADWSAGTAAVVNSSEVYFQRCDESRLFKHRYHVCQSGDHGWKTPVAKISMSPWNPTETTVFFGLRSRSNEQEHVTLRRSIKMRLDRVQSVGAWAVPPLTAKQDACTFLASPADLQPNTSLEVQLQRAAAKPIELEETIMLPILEAAVKGAACEFVKRGCDWILSYAFPHGPEIVSQLVIQTAARGIQAEFVEAMEAFNKENEIGKAEESRFFREALANKAPTLWQVIRCMLQANPSLAARCTPCGGDLNSSDFLCCIPPGSEHTMKTYLNLVGHLSGFSFPCGWPLAASRLPAILWAEPNEADDRLVQLTCETLLGKNGSTHETPSLQNGMLRAAAEAGNLQAVNLTLRHCMESDSELTDTQATALWHLSAQGLDVLRLMWQEFPQHLNAMLQSAVDDRCEVCLAAWRAAEPPAICAQPSHLNRSVHLGFQASIGDSDPSRKAQQMKDSGHFLKKFLEEPPCIWSAVTHLSLEEIDIGTSELAKVIFKLLVLAAASIRSLELFEVTLHSGEAGSFPRLHQLRSLDFFGGSIPPDQFRSLLRDARDLEHVKMSFLPGGTEMLIEFLQNSSDQKLPCQLRTVEVYPNEIEESAVVSLVEGLRNCPLLVEVGLCGCDFNNSAMQVIRQVVGRQAWKALKSFRVDSEEEGERECMDYII